MVKKGSMKQFVIIIAVMLLTILCAFTSPVAASTDFLADYSTQYAISPSGVAIVTQNVTLTNKQSTMFPKEYAVTLDTQNINNVIAYDAKGVIAPKIFQHDDKTDIILPFNTQVVGLGKKMTFTLRYENNDVAKQLGTIWEIQIPGIVDDGSINTYTVSLQTPADFGPATYVYPASTNNRWKKDELTHGGIRIAFGDRQSYDVRLKYHLENNQLTPITSEITLPPDTVFQKVTIKQIDPKPKRTHKDQDGNWLSEYELSGGQKLDVTADLSVTTVMKPREDFQEEPVKKETYLVRQQYWETDNAEIIKLAQTYKTPEDIYNYVTHALTYDYQRVNKDSMRKGAVEALNSPQTSLCSEFTDLFIAIARTAGIPAREAVGFAYTTNKKLRPLSLVSDVLHAWPEYYDEKTQIWIPVDPTWQNTTGGINYFDSLDFNHIVFALHGVSSEQPYPAGSYKKGTQPQKNVSVKFSSTLHTTGNPTIKTSFLFPQIATAGKTFAGSVTFENISGSAVSEMTAFIQSSPFPFAATIKETNIPPFGKITAPVSIPINNYFFLGKGMINVTVNSQTVSYYFSIRPMPWLLIPLALIASGILLLLWLIFRKK